MDTYWKEFTRRFSVSIFLKLKTGTFSINRLILKYAHGGWSNFSSCLECYPTGIAELSNGDIVVCGPEEVGENEYVKPTGHLHVYSPYGKPIRRLDNILGKENMCPVPLRIASCKINKIIAVLDQKNNSVIVLKENGVLLKSYKGDTEHMPLQLPILELEIFCNFSPLGICCSPGGPLFVSTADGSCLHILNHSGEVSFDQL